jgi:hypothetical protein
MVERTYLEQVESFRAETMLSGVFDHAFGPSGEVSFVFRETRDTGPRFLGRGSQHAGKSKQKILNTNF